MYRASVVAKTLNLTRKQISNRSNFCGYNESSCWSGDFVRSYEAGVVRDLYQVSMINDIQCTKVNTFLSTSLQRPVPTIPSTRNIFIKNTILYLLRPDTFSIFLARPTQYSVGLLSRYTWSCWDYVNSVTISLEPGDNGRGSHRLVINFTRQSPRLCSRHHRVIFWLSLAKLLFIQILTWGALCFIHHSTIEIIEIQCIVFSFIALLAASITQYNNWILN